MIDLDAILHLDPCSPESFIHFLPPKLRKKEDVPAKMRIVAEAACAEGETIHNMPGGATPDQVYAALLVADQYGQRFLQEWE